jgi:anti-sigma factor RsiW
MSAPEDPAARALWQRYRQGPPAAVAEPDLMELAAYADGLLDPAASAAVEAWLALHPEALADIAAARDLATGEIAALPAPLPVIRAARGLVTPPPAPLWRRAANWSSVAAAAMVVAVIGFQVGIATATSLGDFVDSDSGYEEDVLL